MFNHWFEDSDVGIISVFDNTWAFLRIEESKAYTPDSAQSVLCISNCCIFSTYRIAKGLLAFRSWIYRIMRGIKCFPRHKIHPLSAFSGNSFLFLWKMLFFWVYNRRKPIHFHEIPWRFKTDVEHYSDRKVFFCYINFLFDRSVSIRSKVSQTKTVSSNSWVYLPIKEHRTGLKLQ